MAKPLRNPCPSTMTKAEKRCNKERRNRRLRLDQYRRQLQWDHCVKVLGQKEVDRIVRKCDRLREAGEYPNVFAQLMQAACDAEWGKQ